MIASFYSFPSIVCLVYTIKSYFYFCTHCSITTTKSLFPTCHCTVGLLYAFVLPTPITTALFSVTVCFGLVCCLFLNNPHMNEICGVCLFSVWFMSFNTLWVYLSMLLQMTRFHLFFNWVLVHFIYTYIPHVYPFIHQWGFGSFAILATVNNAEMNINLFKLVFFLFFG